MNIFLGELIEYNLVDFFLCVGILIVREGQKFSNTDKLLYSNSFFSITVGLIYSIKEAVEKFMFLYDY